MAERKVIGITMQIGKWVQERNCILSPEKSEMELDAENSVSKRYCHGDNGDLAYGELRRMSETTRTWRQLSAPSAMSGRNGSSRAQLE